MNELYEKWKSLKRGIKNTTFEKYVYDYNKYVRNALGNRKIIYIKRTDIIRFCNNLVDENGLMPSTVAGIIAVVRQILTLAVNDDLLNKNPADSVVKDINAIHNDKRQKKCAMTKNEQDLFIEYLRNNKRYFHLYNIVAVMLGTGMRIGEVIGLRYCDVDLDKNYIDINHSLIYCRHQLDEKRKGYYFSVQTPKTPTSIRKVPMMNFVRVAILREKEFQEVTGRKCRVNIDGYTDFIFLTRNGTPRIPENINNSIDNAIRRFNKTNTGNDVISHTTCHKFRHTFATRLYEASTNVKTIQSIMGHSSANVTLDVYTDISEELKHEAVNGMANLFSH